MGSAPSAEGGSSPCAFRSRASRPRRRRAPRSSSGDCWASARKTGRGNERRRAGVLSGMTRLLSLISLIAVAGALAAAPAPAAGGAKIDLAKVGKLGKVLVNGKGRTLYLFEKDKNGKSSCNGTCAKVWSPVTTHGKPKAGSGLKASLLGTTK